ncbi:hypothetical protein FVE85_6410 [Porphyridium purpureum]|uniref:RmlD-like substrate binding domain-containing protein n=1 Tax=Porphyridium purpureum TaxID=35688 RepID=A0A5J4Z666_PORPP|nr:hypothetical protein FVE85_6410 [Porphyridium purpureum]|eukprot:POR6002..scf295_1
MNVIVIGAGGELGFHACEAVCSVLLDTGRASSLVMTYRATRPGHVSRVLAERLQGMKDGSVTEIQLDTSDHAAVQRLIEAESDRLGSTGLAVLFCAVPKHGGAASTGGTAVRAGIVDDVVFAARETMSRGGRFVAISTDQVFDGKPKTSTPIRSEGCDATAHDRARADLNLYTEDPEQDPTCPTNPYGQYKVEMEKSLLELAKSNGWDHLLLIARTSLILGLPPLLREFTGNSDPAAVQLDDALLADSGKAVRFVLNAISNSEQKPLVLFTDEPRNMSFADDLGCALAELAVERAHDENATGILNLVSDEPTNRYELALRLAATLGMTQCNAVPGESKTSGLNRPLDLSLSTHKLHALGLRTRLRGVSERLPVRLDT